MLNLGSRFEMIHFNTLEIAAAVIQWVPWLPAITCPGFVPTGPGFVSPLGLCSYWTQVCVPTGSGFVSWLGLSLLDLWLSCSTTSTNFVISWVFEINIRNQHLVYPGKFIAATLPSANFTSVDADYSSSMGINSRGKQCVLNVVTTALSRRKACSEF